MFYFDIDEFFKLHKNKNIESIQIAEFVKCTLRHIQKYALKNNIPFKRVQGRKEYIWNKSSIQKFALWINRKHEKNILIEKKKKEKEEKDKQYRLKQDEKYKPKNYKSTIEVYRLYFHYNSIPKSIEKTYIRTLQRWAKNNNVEFVIKGKRKYYHWTKKDIKNFNKIDYHVRNDNVVNRNKI